MKQKQPKVYISMPRHHGESAIRYFLQPSKEREKYEEELRLIEIRMLFGDDFWKLTFLQQKDLEYVMFELNDVEKAFELWDRYQKGESNV